ncbi:CoB--CoM heterodisulfide reductase iron-sulfur subunit A family protein [bacterium]|nr:CoB--CoM heterodisulfide reductase iron-sulfur subunit A family protein [bacterium]
MSAGYKEFEKHVVVLGGGAAGIASALALNDLGFKVSIVDKESHLLGTIGQLDKQFPNDACGFCQLRSRIDPGAAELCLRRDLSGQGLDIFNLASLWNVEKLSDGRFKLFFNCEPAFVKPELCVRCRKCEEVCPVEVPDEFNLLGIRKAAYVRYPMAVPSTWVIDGQTCTRCGECVKICPTSAIDLEMKPRELTLDADAVIISTGFSLIDPSYLTELGIRFPNVLTSLELERLLSNYGPTLGVLKRPSDGSIPKKIAMVFCAGSRDREHQYCSAACCMYGAKETRLLKERYPESEITIFYMDRRDYGKPYYSYMEDIPKNVRWVPSRPAKVEETSNDNLLVRYESEEGKIVKEEFDLVTLVVGQEGRADDFAKLFELETREGFIKTIAGSELQTSNPRIFTVGSAGGPKDLPDTIIEAQAAAGQISSIIGVSRKGDLHTASPAPFPKVGIIFDPVAEEGFNQDRIKTFFSDKGIPSAFIQFTETPQGLDELERFVSDNELDRLVLLGPNPNKIEYLVKERLRSKSWHPAQVEIVDFREPLRWTSSGDISEIALTLALAHAEKQRLLSFERSEPFQHIGRAIIVGGGAAGLWASKLFADVGVDVTLLEKEKELGGNALAMAKTLEGFDAKTFTKSLITAIEESRRIDVITDACPIHIDGEPGRFGITIKKGEEEIVRGASVVLFATGGHEYKPEVGEFGWGIEGVVGEKEFAESIEKDALAYLKNVVMIQCVGSRSEDHPYCSRVCCRRALANAIALKEKNPKIEVTIIARDVMSWGLSELYYRKAREMGVNFIRYTLDEPPQVIEQNGRPQVSVFDRILGSRVELNADKVVLALGIISSFPNIEYNGEPIAKDGFGFFKEANPKFRPCELEQEGFFVAGLAKGPKQISESLAEASAAVAKALVFLRREKLAPKYYIARTNERRCAYCGICIDACPNKARVMDDELSSARVIESICQGCGICASACPSGAAHLVTLESDQAFRMIDVLLTQHERGV